MVTNQEQNFAIIYNWITGNDEILFIWESALVASLSFTGLKKHLLVSVLLALHFQKSCDYKPVYLDLLINIKPIENLWI